jgi:hypothetical protein
MIVWVVLQSSWLAVLSYNLPLSNCGGTLMSWSIYPWQDQRFQLEARGIRSRNINHSTALHQLVCGKEKLHRCLYSFIRQEPRQIGRYSHWLRDGRPGGSEFEFRYDQQFSLFYTIQTDCGNHWPSSLFVPRALYTMLKRQGREANHSPPNGAEVKKTKVYIYMHYLSWCSA